MTDFLVDTSVISQLAPGRPPVPERLADWIVGVQDRLFLPAMVIAEIEQGIAQLRRRGSTAKAAVLAEWLEAMMTRFADRVLPLDARVAVEVGRLSDLLVSRGRHPGLADTIIAATARVRGAVLLTQNVRHFEPADVKALDPFLPTFWSALDPP